MLEQRTEGEPIWVRTLSSHWRGPLRCSSIQQGVLVTVCRLQQQHTGVFSPASNPPPSLTPSPYLPASPLPHTSQAHPFPIPFSLTPPASPSQAPSPHSTLPHTQIIGCLKWPGCPWGIMLNCTSSQMTVMFRPPSILNGRTAVALAW